MASHILLRLPTVGVFAKATPQDTPKAVVTKTDEPMRRFVLAKKTIFFFKEANLTINF